MNVILTLVLSTFLCHLHHGDCRPLKVKRDEDHMTDALVSQRKRPKVHDFKLKYYILHIQNPLICTRTWKLKNWKLWLIRLFLLEYTVYLFGKKYLFKI